MKLDMPKEWWMRKIAEEPEGECGAGFEIDFRDASGFVDMLRDVVKPAHDPEVEKNNPNLFKYDDEE